jgi:hypothetical protein
MRERHFICARSVPYPALIRAIHGAHPSGRLRRSRVLLHAQSAPQKQSASDAFHRIAPRFSKRQREQPSMARLPLGVSLAW